MTTATGGTLTGTDIAKSQKEEAIGKLSKLAVEARNFGAPMGAQRATQVLGHFDTLTPKDAFQWLDPDGLRVEVEEAQFARANSWHAARNVFSLLPLILTWLAISLATLDYQADLAKYKQADDGQTFLSLWQTGFHNADPLTFAVAGFVDVALLVVCLICILRAQRVERNAKHTTAKFSRTLDDVSASLMKASDTHGAIQISSDVSAQSIAETVQRMFDKARDSVVQVSDRMNTLLTHLDTDMTKMHDELTQNATQITGLTTATSGLSGAATALATNADAYVKAGDGLRTQIDSLDKTQRGVLTQLTAVATGIESAATDISTVSREVTIGLRPSLSDMTLSVTEASGALGTVSAELQQTAAQLTAASAGLRGVNVQVGDLGTTQKGLADVLNGLGTDVSTSAKSIAKVADEIAGPMQTNVEHMTHNILGATRNLSQYQLKMDETVNKLLYAADQLNAAATQLGNVIGVPGAAGGAPPKRHWWNRRSRP